MARVKANCVCFIRRLLRAQSMSTEQSFLTRFTPEEAKLYQNVLPVLWVEETFACKVGESAAAILHPGDPKGLRHLSLALARSDIHGIYRTLFSIFTIPFLMRQAPAIWKIYHDTGLARTERPSGKEKKVDLLVTGYPEMRETWRELISGYIQGILEPTGNRNVQVAWDQPEAGTWRWIITWD